MRTMLESALWLESQGCSVIPLFPRNKEPYAPCLPEIEVIEKGCRKLKRSWIPYQTKRATAEDIREWFDRKLDINIGLVCGAISGVVCVDVDGEKGQEWFAKNIGDHKPNLFQFTSAAYKFHAFFKHPGNGIHIPPSVKGIHPEVDIRGDTSYCVFAPSVHPNNRVYDLHELSGFTGMDSLIPLPDLFLDYVKKQAEPIAAPIVPDVCDFGQEIPEGQRDVSITSYAGHLFGKGLQVEEVRALCHILNQSKCRPPLSESDVNKCVDSIHRTHGRNNPLAFNAGGLLKWVENSKGSFTVNDIFSQLSLKQPNDKAQALAALNTLEAQKVIERCGKDNNTYRKRLKENNVLDLTQKIDTTSLPLVFPLGLTRDVNIQKKNIIVVSGETNSGKTGFLLNVVFMNMSKFKFTYLSSEMGIQELQGRVAPFGKSFEEWQKVCTFRDVSHNQHDYVDPDGITLIDFLENSGETPWTISEEITKIFNRLNTGVAIIAMQKRTGKDIAVGGEATIEKARLAINLYTHGRLDDGIFGRAKIIKCKNFVNGRNPEYKEIFYQQLWGYYYSVDPIHGFPDYDGRLRWYTESERDRQIEAIQRYCKYQNNSKKNDEPYYDAYGNVIGG